MKKALIIALVVVMALSVVGLVSCAGTTYEGVYSYANPWNPKQSYGCKVQVTVQGDVITNVVIEEDTAEMYNLSAGWTVGGQGEMSTDSEGKTNWRKFGQAMADSFVGLTTKEVLGMKVYVGPTGEPITGKSYVETVKYIPEQLNVVIGGHSFGEDVEIAKGAGATQSSARLILAVQDALLQANGDVSKNANCVAVDLYTGSCSYTVAEWYTTYGAKVDVMLKDGKISWIKLYEDSETNWVRTTASWTEDAEKGQLGFQKTEAAYDEWITKTFVGKTPAEILALDVTVFSGKITAVQSYGVTVNTESVAIAGATQSSARIIAAVQNALASFKTK